MKKLNGNMFDKMMESTGAEKNEAGQYIKDDKVVGFDLTNFDKQVEEARPMMKKMAIQACMAQGMSREQAERRVSWDGKTDFEKHMKGE